jgi:eukaryotic-like serine/threonine-protein kinase
VSSQNTILGKYQIIREIARSNDIVYEAYDPLMDRRVALKELAIPNGSSPQQVKDRVERFEREARAAGRLAHTNIMTVYDVGSDGDRHYMAMEYLDGHTLRNELDTKGMIEHSRAIEIITAVLEGLEHAHNNGVVHRDIKPDNIQLTTSGVKITDFGIARLTFQPNLTMDGQVFGTPSYMSPEQIKGGDIDARSDIFSAGVVLYEMLSGQKPFQGDSVIAITHCILNTEPMQPSAIGYALWHPTKRALDKSPGLRFSSADEMLAAIKQAESGDGLVLANPYVTGAFGSAPPVIAPPPAPTYGYNPYVPGPHTVGPQPTQAPPTIYYPPPPRRPLMNPRQQALFKRIGLICLVMGTFFAMVIVAIMAASGKFSSEVPNQSSTAAVTDKRPTKPITDIEPETTAENYEAIAQIQISATEFSELSEDQRRSLLEGAAETVLKQAQASLNEGRPSAEVRELIYKARRLAPEGSEVRKKAEEAVKQIT